MPSRADQLLLQLLMEQIDTLPVQCRHIEHMHEGGWFTKNNFDKMTAVKTKTFFPNKAFVYAWIVPLWADQFLPQLLMEQIDSLPIQYTHIEHMYEGVSLTKIFLTK